MTAEEFIKNKYFKEEDIKKSKFNFNELKELMIEYGKYHVEQTLKAAADMAQKEHNLEIEMGDGQFSIISILNSYPLENIK